MNPRRRLRSKNVIIGSVGVLVTGLCAYGVLRGNDEDRTCVNDRNEIIDDDDCEDGRSGARWYYGGVRSGGKVTGGSFTRGGFGGHGGSTGS